LRRLVLDVLISHEPNVLEYAERISELQGVDGLTLHVSAMDERTRTVETTVEGEDLSFESIKEVVDELGGSIHAVDEVSAGARGVTRERLTEDTHGQ